MSPKKKLNVLMITGVYLPEINGAVRQCNQLINNLRESVNYSVLAGTNEKSNDGCYYIDGISVIRVLMPRMRKLKYMIGAVSFFVHLIKMLRDTDLVHIHGFSKRNAISIAIILLFRKRVLIKMTSYGHDDPMSIKRFNSILWRIFSCCHAYIGISPAFLESFQNTELFKYKYNFIPNGVELTKYFPVTQNQKSALRSKYGFTSYDKIIIFIGHFSIDKRPMLLYMAWVKLFEQNLITKIIFIGYTKDHFEVDEGIVELIKQDTIIRGIDSHISFVEETSFIDEYLKIADIFVLTSVREGLPNVLLEAMACALPCIVSELPGVTDWLINHKETGLLFHSEDPYVLANLILFVFKEYSLHKKMGLKARYFIESNFSSTKTSTRTLDLYKKIMLIT